MKISRTTTKTYDIYDCAKCQMTVGDTILKREQVGMKTKGFDKCFICKHNFNSDEIPYLALVRNHPNTFICKNCAKQINKERVEEDEN